MSNGKAPGAVGAASEGQIPEGTSSMDIMTEPPAGYESWPDIRSIQIKGAGLITPDIVAGVIAEWEEHQTGRRLIHRASDAGRYARVYVHPDLVASVDRWYRDARSSLSNYTPSAMADMDPLTGEAKP